MAKRGSTLSASAGTSAYGRLIDENRDAVNDEDSNTANKFIWEKLQKTYEWRIAQILEGKIEIRTDKTLDKLEAIYNNEDILSLLELPRESAKYDIYNVFLKFKSDGDLLDNIHSFEKIDKLKLFNFYDIIQSFTAAI
jgi:hypothetical protein